MQCVAACCSVLQSVAMCCTVLQCVAVCCRVMQCVSISLPCLTVCACVFFSLKILLTHTGIRQVMLRVPLPAGLMDCKDVCLSPSNPNPGRFVGLKVKYSGLDLVDNLQITPNTANAFCLGTNWAIVKNVTRDTDFAVTATVTDSSGTSWVTLPYYIVVLDLTINMPLVDAWLHDPVDTWTLTCGGNSLGFAVMSFPVVPSVCSVIISPFN